MAVFRIEKTKDYTVMSNYHLRDKRLSLKSKGLLSLILSLPNDWNYSIRGFASICKEGVDCIGATLRELEKANYIERNKLRDERGRITEIEYVIFEFPQVNPNTYNSNTGNPNSDNPNTGNPHMGSPHTENPYMDNPCTENPTQLNKELNNNKLSNDLNNKNIKQTNPSMQDSVLADSQQLISGNTNQHTQHVEHLKVKTAHGTGIPANHAMTLVEQQFEQFWQVYPRKASKKSARDAWFVIHPDDNLFSNIMNAIKDIVQYWSHHGTSQKHIPYPSTWLNEERWNDELLYDQLQKSNITSFGGVQNANTSAGYTIGGSNDPYRVVMQ